MKLTEPFTKTGEFFIEGKSYRGILSYDPKNGFFLNLKNLPFEHDNKSFPLMAGIIDGEPYSCTLLNLYPQKNVFSGNPDGMTRTSTYVVQAMLGDKAITDAEKIQFNKVRFVYSNFREWLNKPTVFVNLNYDDTTDDIIQLKKFSIIRGSMNESFDFEIEIHNTGSYGSTQGDFSISLEQSVTFGIVGKNGKLFQLPDYLKLNKAIKYFFMFLQGRYVVEENIYCDIEKDDKRAYEHVLDFFLFQRRLKQAKKLENTEHFTHPYNPFIFERILQNWIKKYEEMPDFFDKFFENWIKEDLSPIDKFENLFQALMYYYNCNFDETVMSEEEYTQFFNSLKKKLEEKEQKFVDRFRLLGNKLSLRSQLNKIFEQLEYLKNSERREKYVGMIVELRNRIQHATDNISPDLLRDSSNMAHNLNSFTSNLILHEIKYEKRLIKQRKLN